MTDPVLISTHGSVRTLHFNRPEKKNAITAAMYAAFADALEEAAYDPAIRVVTLTAEGDFFTAGNDINDFLANPPADSNQPVFRFLRAISAFPKPLVAGVGGGAVGVGTTMLLHCDLVVATRKAFFSLPFVDLALVPEAASSLLLPKLIGPQRAALHLLLGTPFDAQTALGYGLVTEIVEDNNLARRVSELAAALAAKPPKAVQLAKALIRGGDEPVAARMERESLAFAERLQSAEAREALQAFLEKRAPDFA